jgi:hypothetical protein
LESILPEEQRWPVLPVIFFGGTFAVATLLWIKKRRFVGGGIFFGALLLLAVTAPSMKPARFEAQRNACVLNLGVINRAKVDWSERFPESVGTELTVEQLAGTNRFLRQFPTCPGGGVYLIGKAGELPICSLAAKGHLLVATNGVRSIEFESLGR